MEITFQSFELRDLCQSQEVAELALSKAAARALRMILADMRAAATMTEFMAIHCVREHGAAVATLLSETDAIFFHQGHLHPPQKGDCIDWDKVYRVRILSIGGIDA